MFDSYIVLSCWNDFSWSSLVVLAILSWWCIPLLVVGPFAMEAINGCHEHVHFTAAWGWSWTSGIGIVDAWWNCTASEWRLFLFIDFRSARPIGYDWFKCMVFLFSILVSSLGPWNDPFLITHSYSGHSKHHMTRQSFVNPWSTILYIDVDCIFTTHSSDAEYAECIEIEDPISADGGYQGLTNVRLASSLAWYSII